jgi:hypothetical protein
MNYLGHLRVDAPTMIYNSANFIEPMAVCQALPLTHIICPDYGYIFSSLCHLKPPV